MGYSFKITDSFWRDFDEVFDYISTVLDNKTAAQRMAEKTNKAFLLIKDNPFIYPLYHDELIAAKNYRYAVIGNYLLFYRIHEDLKETIIEALVYGRQNLAAIIK